MKSNTKARTLAIARIAFHERKKEGIGERHMHETARAKKKKADGGAIGNSDGETSVLSGLENYFSPSNQEWAPWPVRVVRSGLSALAAPHDAYTGDLPMMDSSGHTSDDAIKRSADLAGLMALGGTGAPSGAIGSGAMIPKRAPLPMDEASRLARAKDMGFYTEMPLYHGTGETFGQFKAVPTNADGWATPGVSTAVDPEIANEFAARPGSGLASPQVHKLFHRADSPAVLTLTGNESHREVVGALRDAFANGYDAVRLRNYTSPDGKKGDIVIVRDANQLRSPAAKFDPAKKASSDLLALNSQGESVKALASGGAVNPDPVTDPALLAQLNAPDDAASAPQAVTDPAILAQLNSDKPPADFSWAQAVTDIPAEIGHAASENFDTIKKAFVPNGQGAQGTLERMANTGRGLAVIPALAMSPLTGTYRSLVGHPMANLEHAAGTVINPEVAAKDDPAAMYEAAKGDVDTAMTAAAARSGLKPPVVASPTPVMPADPLGVTLSEGQRTAELPAIRIEQAALRGQLGAEAEARAKAFAEQQNDQLAVAKAGIAKQLDPASQVIVDTPQEAGQIASQTVQQEARRAKQGVTDAYDRAKALPGEIHADAFRDMGDVIKQDISNRPEPIIIDDKLTPMASHMVRDIEDRLTKLQIQNRADPNSPPDPTQITGVTLKGVDQVRKRLSTFRKDAFASGNATDGRAAQAVLDAFDSRIDRAVNEGMFNGDPSAVQAWNAARAAHSDFMQTFGKGKNDPVGRVVERIIGTKSNPAAIPNDVADFMYGATGTNPSSLNVGVANRLKKIMGEDSPEWSAVRQGLFNRAVNDFGHDRAAKNLDKLLNTDGKELSQVVFTPAQRQLLQQYADLRKQLQVPATGVNRSETSTFVAPMMKKLTAGVAAVVGAMLGHAIAPGAYGVGELIGAGIIGKGANIVGDAAKARKIANQMPLVADKMKKYQRAVAVHARGNAPSSPALAAATVNLARSLGQIGFDYAATLRMLQGTVPGSAQDEQQKP